MLANWPLLLIRIGESVLLGFVIVAGIVAVILPLVFGVAWSELKIESADPDRLIGFFLEYPLIIPWVVIGITVILILAVAIHSFVQAGCMGIYVDGEQMAGAGSPARSAYSAFSPERWWNYGRRFWWPVFLIYNIAWGLFGLVLLLPLLALLAMVLALRDRPSVAIAGCLGVAAVILVSFVGGIIVTLWSDLAIGECVRSGAAARESLRRAGVIFRRFLTDVLTVFAVLLALSILVMMVMLSIYFIIGLGSAVPGLSLVFLPAQIALSFAQNIVSVFIAAWFLAAFAGVIIKAQGALETRG